MMAQDLHLITISEAAEMFAIPRTTIQHWIMRRRIAKYKAELGKEVYIDEDELREKLTRTKQSIASR
jgi:excisionase family DNA binding protein